MEECPICLDFLTIEKTQFKCGHCICLTCFSEYLIKNINDNNDRLLCPLCRGIILHLKKENTIINIIFYIFLLLFLFFIFIMILNSFYK